MTTAESLVALKERYGDNETVGRAIGVSGEMVREFLGLLRLDPKARRLWRQRQLDSVDIGYRVSLLPREAHLPLADLVLQRSLTSKDVRAVVSFLLSNPDWLPEAAVDRVLASKDLTVYVAYFSLLPGDLGRLLAAGMNPDSALPVLKQELEKLAGADNVMFSTVDGSVLTFHANAAGLAALRDEARAHHVPLHRLPFSLLSRILESTTQKTKREGKHESKTSRRND